MSTPRNAARWRLAGAGVAAVREYARTMAGVAIAQLSSDVQATVRNVGLTVAHHC